MKFRIKKVEGLGFFAQVQTGDFFFKNWYTIGAHSISFGLYAEDHIDYPVSSMKEAKVLISKYKVSLTPKRIEYFGVN